MKPEFIYMETPSGNSIRIYYDEIEDIAAQDGIDTLAQDMTDAVFYEYADLAFERRSA